jgi:peptidoglycan/xylan/chitin deacetylase (PgdA/CDA1 family)
MFHGVDRSEGAAFAEQMSFLARHFTVVPLDWLLARRGSGQPPRNEMALSFDDGLRNNYTVVYPVLRRLGLPASYFVCPGLAGGGRWLWTHEVRSRLAHLASTPRRQVLATAGVPAAEADRALEWLKGASPHVRRKVADAIEAATPDFEPTEVQHDRFDLMSWEELTELDPALITIGSHSMSHAMLPTLSAAEMAFEVEESRRRLEERLGREVRYFCYPDGRHTRATVDCTRRVYQGAVLADCGVVGPGTDPYRLPRIPIAPDDPALLAWRMHRPWG